MPPMQSNSKVGVYADVANLSQSGGSHLQYDVLREFACRDNAEPVRLNAYVVRDTQKAKSNQSYRNGKQRFHSKLRDYGYKVIVKEVKWFTNESGERYGKANADLDLAVDALLQSENLDRVLIVSGDGDFVQVVRALQNKGIRVEVVAPDNVSLELRREADIFMCGYLIPRMIPIGQGENGWSGTGSRVRGWCYWFNEEKGYGFLRFLKRITTGLWITDARDADSPYGTCFVHVSDLPPTVNPDNLPSRDHIFEFEVARSNRSDLDEGDELEARDIELTTRL